MWDESAVGLTEASGRSEGRDTDITDGEVFVYEDDSFAMEKPAIAMEQGVRDSRPSGKIYFFEACSVSGDSVQRPLEF